MVKRITVFILLALSIGLFSVMSISASPAQEFGSGWTASYYNNAQLSGSPVFTEVLPNGINFNWGAGSPNPAVPVDNFSARYGSVQNFSAGTYEFVVGSDDGVRVFIDGVLVLDRFIGRVFTIDRFQQTLTAGPHQITVEYMELVDQAQVQFQWFLINAVPQFGTQFPVFGTPFVPVVPGVAPTVTPIPPTPLPEIPAGALSATVIRARVLLTRSGPFFASPVVGRILRGQTYQVLGRDEDARWFLLQLSGMQAWAWGYYLNVNGNEFNAPVVGGFVTQGWESSVVAQTQATMRLRAAPNVLSEQIGRVPWGDVVPVIGRTAAGDWLQVVFRGTTGWLASAYTNIVEGDFNSVPVTG